MSQLLAEFGGISVPASGQVIVCRVEHADKNTVLPGYAAFTNNSAGIVNAATGETYMPIFCDGSKINDTTEFVGVVAGSQTEPSALGHAYVSVHVRGTVRMQCRRQDIEDAIPLVDTIEFAAAPVDESEMQLMPNNPACAYPVFKVARTATTKTVGAIISKGFPPLGEVMIDLMGGLKFNPEEADALAIGEMKAKNAISETLSADVSAQQNAAKVLDDFKKATAAFIENAPWNKLEQLAMYIDGAEPLVDRINDILDQHSGDSP